MSVDIRCDVCEAEVVFVRAGDMLAWLQVSIEDTGEVACDKCRDAMRAFRERARGAGQRATRETYAALLDEHRRKGK